MWDILVRSRPMQGTQDLAADGNHESAERSCGVIVTNIVLLTHGKHVPTPSDMSLKGANIMLPYLMANGKHLRVNKAEEEPGPASLFLHGRTRWTSESVSPVHCEPNQG